MKKIIATIASLTMAFALCSCGKSADSETAAAQPSEVTTAATLAETAAVTTVPQSTTTTTAESETTTPENTTTTAEVTTTSDSTTTTAAEKQTTTAEKKTTTAKQTTAAPKNTTAAKQTAAPKQTTAASKQTSAPKQTTARQTTTAKKTTTTSKQTAAPKRTTTAPKQTASPKETVVDMSKIDDQMWIFLEEYPIDYNAMYKQGKLYRNLSDCDKAAAVTKFAYETGGQSCIYYALNTYFLAQGAGLECYLVRNSNDDWYGHVANVAKLDGEYYYIEPQINMAGLPYNPYDNYLNKITDIYDNIISVTIADHYYKDGDLALG